MIPLMIRSTIAFPFSLFTYKIGNYVDGTKDDIGRVYRTSKTL